MSSISIRTARSAVDRFRDAVTNEFRTNPFVVFLCGPSIERDTVTAGAELRRRLQIELTALEFDVVLGEDDGLEWLRRKYGGGLADDNEATFVEKYAGAVVIVAASVGSFCEVGLFSHVCCPARSKNKYKGDLILIANSAYEHDESYFRYGPAESVNTLGGALFWASFDSFDTKLVVNRLMRRRTVWVNKRLRR